MTSRPKYWGGGGRGGGGGPFIGFRRIGGGIDPVERRVSYGRAPVRATPPDKAFGAIRRESSIPAARYSTLMGGGGGDAIRPSGAARPLSDARVRAERRRGAAGGCSSIKIDNARARCAPGFGKRRTKAAQKLRASPLPARGPRNIGVASGAGPTKQTANRGDIAFAQLLSRRMTHARSLCASDEAGHDRAIAWARAKRRGRAPQMASLLMKGKAVSQRFRQIGRNCGLVGDPLQWFLLGGPQRAGRRNRGRRTQVSSLQTQHLCRPPGCGLYRSMQQGGGATSRGKRR
jgi:hypothetical protein